MTRGGVPNAGPIAGDHYGQANAKGGDPKDRATNPIGISQVTQQNSGFVMPPRLRAISWAYSPCHPSNCVPPYLVGVNDYDPVDSSLDHRLDLLVLSVFRPCWRWLPTQPNRVLARHSRLSTPVDSRFGKAVVWWHAAGGCSINLGEHVEAVVGVIW